MNAHAYSWSDDDYQKLMRTGWQGGRHDGTECGSGSTMANTAELRAWLPLLVAEHGIESVCDAGAGDMHWIKHVDWSVDYQAFDLYPRVEGVRIFDVTKTDLPECDLIICRHVLEHMAPHMVLATLRRFKRSGKFLLASTHSGREAHLESPESFNKWNLAQEPFSLGIPVEERPDKSGKHRIALWRLA